MNEPGHGHCWYYWWYLFYVFLSRQLYKVGKVKKALVDLNSHFFPFDLLRRWEGKGLHWSLLVFFCVQRCISFRRLPPPHHYQPPPYHHYQPSPLHHHHPPPPHHHHRHRWRSGAGPSPLFGGFPLYKVPVCQFFKRQRSFHGPQLLNNQNSAGSLAVFFTVQVKMSSIQW